MIERIKSAVPFLIFIIVLAALVNVGAIPGKTKILNFLGLAKSNTQEETRSFDYVPERILELSSPSLSNQQLESSPLPSSGNFGQASPSPLIGVPSPSPYRPEQPPPPPPFVLGASDVQNPPVSDAAISESTDINSEEVKDEDFLQSIKDYFGGIINF